MGDILNVFGVLGGLRRDEGDAARSSSTDDGLRGEREQDGDED